MDKASVYGTGDCRFESYQGHSFYTCLFCISEAYLRQRDENLVKLSLLMDLDRGPCGVMDNALDF